MPINPDKLPSTKDMIKDFEKREAAKPLKDRVRTVCIEKRNRDWAILNEVALGADWQSRAFEKEYGIKAQAIKLILKKNKDILCEIVNKESLEHRKAMRIIECRRIYRMMMGKPMPKFKHGPLDAISELRKEDIGDLEEGGTGNAKVMIYIPQFQSENQFHTHIQSSKKPSGNNGGNKDNGD